MSPPLECAVALLDLAHEIEAQAWHHMRWGNFEAKMAEAAKLRAKSRAIAATHHAREAGA